MRHTAGADWPSKCGKGGITNLSQGGKGSGRTRTPAARPAERGNCCTNREVIPQSPYKSGGTPSEPSGDCVICRR